MSDHEDAYLLHLHQRLGLHTPAPPEAPYLTWADWPADGLMPPKAPLSMRGRNAITLAADAQRQDAKRYIGSKVYKTVGEFVTYDRAAWLETDWCGDVTADELLRFFGHHVPTPGCP